MDFEIKLHDLLFYGFHGVMEHEREFGNEFRVNLSVKIPYRRGIDEDDLDATVSYAILYDIVSEEMSHPHKLLEKVAIQISKRIKAEFPYVISGRIEIEKSRPPIRGMLGSASVVLNF